MLMFIVGKPLRYERNKKNPKVIILCRFIPEKLTSMDII